MAATKPTAATFFASHSAANRTKIQALLNKIAAGAPKDNILSEATALGQQMNAADREQLISLAYQQLAAR